MATDRPSGRAVVSRDLLAGTSLTPWIPPQAPTTTSSNTVSGSSRERSTFCELLTSQNPAWAMVRYMIRDGHIHPGRIDWDRVHEAADYCDERVK